MLLYAADIRHMLPPPRDKRYERIYDTAYDAFAVLSAPLSRYAFADAAAAVTPIRFAYYVAAGYYSSCCAERYAAIFHTPYAATPLPDAADTPCRVCFLPIALSLPRANARSCYARFAL